MPSSTRGWYGAVTILAVTVATTARPSSAADAAGASASDKAGCTAAYESAQRARAAGQFRAARGELLTCGRTSCPVALRKDCLKWLEELDSAQPTVVIAASNAGAEVDDVRVTVDGELVTDHLRGMAIRVDPGEHVFHFEHGSDAPVDEKMVVREGEKARRIEVAFAEAVSSASATRASRPVPTATYVAGAVAGAGLLTFVVFAAYGTFQKGTLDSCKPNCTESDVDAARRSFYAADIGLAAAVIGAGLGVVAYVTRPEIEVPSVRAGGTVVPGGAVVGVGGRF